MSARSKARAQYRAQGRKPQHVQPGQPIDLEEARKKAAAAPKATAKTAPRSLSFAWDETEALGITSDMRRSGPGMLSEQDRKDTLYQAYIANVWISACVDVIAKRITSGGFVIEEVEQGQGSEANRDTIKQLLGFVNDDDDFLQLVRAIITDLLIYGEAYMEIVRKNGKPFSLHKIDCQTMSYRLEPHGKIIQYIQNVNHSNDTVTFAPEDVIRWWLPDPKAHKKALSPIERILGPVDADTHMDDWIRSFFRKGARPNIVIDFPGNETEAARFVAWLRETYTGQANAHVPMVLWGGAKATEFGKGSVDIDFDKGSDKQKEKILAGFQVPPAIVSQIESGNIGGGTGESQDKSFQYNACDPVKQLFFEKFNYRILQQGFGITDWRVNTRYADYRNETDVVTVQTKRIERGLTTPDEERQEMGKPPYPKGGSVPLIVLSRDLIPLERIDELADEQRQSAQVDFETKQAAADLAKTKAEQAKHPPKPASMPGQGMPPTPAAAGRPQQGVSGISGVAAQAQESANHSGIMVAFMLSDDVAQQLAIPGGEPANELHCTLAYLGDADEWTPAQQQGMQRIVSQFASSHPPVGGHISGGAQFNAPEGQPEPIVALVDAPDLPAFRQALVHALADGGYVASKEHGYTAHISLKFAEPGDETPIPRLPSMPLLFDRLLLAIGGEQFIYLLSGTKQEERWRARGSPLRYLLEDASDPKASAASGSPNGGVLLASSKT